MRYEHITIDMSAAACAALLKILEEKGVGKVSLTAGPELINLANELRARLQRRDSDPKADLTT